VKYPLVSEAGYPFYPQALSVRAGEVDQLASCLEKLVPIVQRAQIDYLNDPAATNALIVDLVEQYDTGWVYSAGWPGWSGCWSSSPRSSPPSASRPRRA
jgi:hypothetical protein